MILAEEVGDLCDELEVIVCLFVCFFLLARLVAVHGRTSSKRVDDLPSATLFVWYIPHLYPEMYRSFGCTYVCPKRSLYSGSSWYTRAVHAFMVMPLVRVFGFAWYCTRGPRVKRDPHPCVSLTSKFNFTLRMYESYVRTHSMAG